MTQSGNPPQIVVAFDSSEPAELALDKAIQLANRETPAVIHRVPPRRYIPTRGKLVPVRDRAWILW